MAIDTTNDNTVITIYNPKAELLNCLATLPAYFLPANPRYQFCRIDRPKEMLDIPNEFAVFAKTDAGKNMNSPFFTPEDLKEIGIPNLGMLSATEEPRVEVLPYDILPNYGQPEIKYVYVDGLRVDTSYRKYALGWSFYGFREANSGYRARRSNNSLNFDGNVDDLMAMALRKCDKANIFYQILQNSVGDNKCEEGDISANKFQDLDKPTLQAISQAWKKFVETHELAGKEVYITSNKNDDLAKMANEKGIHVIVINSEAMVQAITKAAGVKTVEETLRITKVAENTGETMINFRIDSDWHAKFACEGLVRTMAESRGRIVPTEPKPANPNTIRIVFDESSIENYRGSYHELPPYMKKFVEDMALAFGNQVTCRIAVNDGKENNYFILRMDDYYSGRINEDVRTNITKGQQAAESNQRGIIIDIIPDSNFKSEALDKFQNQLKDDLLKLTGPDGYIDPVLYAQSGEASTASILAAITAKKLAMEQMERTIHATLNSANSSLATTRLAFNDYGSAADHAGASEVGYLALGNTFVKGLIRWFRPDETITGLTNEYIITSAASPFRSGDFKPTWVNYPLAREIKPGFKKMTINKPFPAGNHKLPFLAGYKPVAYHHSFSPTPISVQVDPAHKVYNFTVDRFLPSGLQIYYEIDNSIDNTPPSPDDTRQILTNIYDLPSIWQDLIIELKESNLTDKQKADIILTAWSRTLSYSDDPTLDEIYKSKGAIDTVRVLSEGRVNCGYASWVASALARAVGIPTQHLGSLYATLGRVVEDHDSHAINRWFLGGQWVYIEPQGGYISKQYRIDPIDKRFIDLINRLPRKVMTPAYAARMSKHMLALYSPLIAAAPVVLAAYSAIGWKALEFLNDRGIIQTFGETQSTNVPANISFPFNLPDLPAVNLPYISPETWAIALLLGEIPIALKLGEIRGKRLLAEKLQVEVNNL